MDDDQKDLAPDSAPWGGGSHGVALARSDGPVVTGAAPATGRNKQPLRMVFLYHPIGAETLGWQGSQGEGKQFQLSPTLRALEPVKEHLVVIDGMNGRPNPRVGHVKSCAHWLSSAPPRQTDAWGVETDITLDQIVAPRLCQGATQPSLELSCNKMGKSMHSLFASWSKPGVPMGAETDPREVFGRMFGNARRDLFRRSILDVVSEDAKRLRSNLGRADQGRLDEYLASVRSLERQIAAFKQQAQRPPTNLKMPQKQPTDLTQYVRLMVDLLVVALQTNHTRVATLLLGNDGFGTYRRTLADFGIEQGQFAGIKNKYLDYGHHKCTHDPKPTRAMIQAMDRWYVTHLLHLLQKMRGIREGDGTLLDHSVVVYGSPNGGGSGRGWPGHSSRSVACVIAGKGGGRIRNTGRHLQTPKATPISNLWLTLAQLVGVERKQFGLSTGTLSGLA